MTPETIPHPGYHEWAPWRYALAEFAKRLFPDCI